MSDCFYHVFVLVLLTVRSNVANASDTERITLTRPSMVYEDDRTLVHRHVLTHIEQLKPTKIRIDGFHVSGDIGFGPFAWQITSPIKLEFYCIVIMKYANAGDFCKNNDCLINIHMLLVPLVHSIRFVVFSWFNI